MRISIDPTTCAGHGMCAELLPELVALDDWDYPVVRPGEVPPELRRAAARAAHYCPALAVRLTSD